MKQTVPLHVPAKEGKVKKKRKGNPGGRPSLLTADTVSKLELAFSYAFTTSEACNYAGISRNTYYRYLKENPKFSDKIKSFQEKPIMIAKETVMKGLQGDARLALRYLELRRPNEFKTKQLLEHETPSMSPERRAKIERALEKARLKPPSIPLHIEQPPERL